MVTFYTSSSFVSRIGQRLNFAWASGNMSEYKRSGIPLEHWCLYKELQCIALFLATAQGHVLHSAIASAVHCKPLHEARASVPCLRSTLGTGLRSLTIGAAKTHPNFILFPLDVYQCSLSHAFPVNCDGIMPEVVRAHEHYVTWLCTNSRCVVVRPPQHFQFA